MKQFKIFMIMIAVLFSNFLFSAEGGGGGSKEFPTPAADHSDQDKRNMKLIMAKWLKNYCLEVNGRLRACLFRAPKAVALPVAPEAEGTKYVNLEWVGSGIVIARALKITEEMTYEELTQAAAAKLNDGTPPHSLLLFNGHGGDEITSTNFRNLIIETLVMTRMTKETYLARQKEAMKALYELLADGGMIKTDALKQFKNPDPRTWLDVREVSSEGFILQLRSNSCALRGQIPRELGRLTELQELDLSFSFLKGAIPTELGKLTSLTYLSLNKNQLTGAIPRELGLLTKLERVNLSHNKLKGTIPTELENLTKLIYLDLSCNQLTGQIPTELGKLTELRELRLSDNQLTGKIPQKLIQRGVRVSR